MSGMTERDLLLGITEGVLFIWERGMLMTCVMRTMRRPAFFRRMAKSRRLPSRYSCRGPSLSYPPAPFCHARRPLSVMPAGPLLSCPPAPLCHACRSFSVMPAGPSLSYSPALLCHACRPLPVILAGPSLSYLPVLLCHARRSPSVIPAVFSGNPELNL